MGRVCRGGQADVQRFLEIFGIKGSREKCMKMFEVNANKPQVWWDTKKEWKIRFKLLASCPATVAAGRADLFRSCLTLLLLARQFGLGNPSSPALC
jgi:hypothetical protein